MSKSIEDIRTWDWIAEDLTFGEPWRLTEKSLSAVIPILRRNLTKRNYVLIQEVQDKVIIEDTGSIGRARVKNQTDKNVFIRKGTLLKGATQARGVTVGTVILPEMSKELEIQCVHASRGIRAGAIMNVAPSIAPRRVEKSFLRRGGQSSTWEAVARDSHARYSMAALPQTGFSDDLVGALEQTTRFKDEIEKALEKIPADRMDQVGVAILDIREVLGVEFFDQPDSWRAFSKSIIRNYADVITQETSDLYEIKMEKVAAATISFLQKLAEAKETVVAEVEGSKTYALDGEETVGEYTTLEGKMIHLIGARKEKEDLRPQQPPIRWPGTLPTRPSYRHQTPPSTTAPQTPQWVRTASPEHLFRYKGGYQLLMSLQEPKTWQQLEEDIPLSTRTLSKRVSEAQDLGLINHKPLPENGVKRPGRPARMTYQLTSEGAEALKKAKSFIRT